MSTVPPQKPHVLLIPFPAQGHINPILKLAKLLHSRGFHITFVNTEYSHHRMLQTHGPSALRSLDDFRVETIPDGLPLSDDVNRDISTVCFFMSKNSPAPFRDLVLRLMDPSSNVPPVTCIISDGTLSFTLDVAKELGILGVFFWTMSACGLLAYLHYPHLFEKGLIPLKDISNLSDGYLDMKVDWVPAMSDMRLRDFPSFIRTMDRNDYMLNFVNHQIQRTYMADAVILNTFDELEHSVLEAMTSILPPIYTIGPLDFLCHNITNSQLESIRANLWKGDQGCLEWLDQKEPGSVVYVNFGSITVMTNDQLIEFAWGLAKSNYHFLWIIRPDLVKGDDAVLPQEFLTETKGRALLASWCQQDLVLSHPSIGGFLTHGGWNSTLESMSNGVPMLCWPFFADQLTNCKYMCTEWGIGMEIDNDVNRGEVEWKVKELMGREKGEEMRKRALEWKEKAVRAAEAGGSSYVNLERMVEELLLPKIDM